jgi:hypothetical protein
MTCQPAAAPGYCADVTTDTNNCGDCFHVCPGGFFCKDKVCMPQSGGADGGTVQCGAPLVTCYPPTAPPYCSDLKYDRLNCGMCGHPCAASEACMNGECVPQAGGIVCDPPTQACDGKYCADFKGDRANCGGCHIQCGQLEICNQGVCEPAPV